jgi:hypothetical protein
MIGGDRYRGLYPDAPMPVGKFGPEQLRCRLTEKQAGLSGPWMPVSASMNETRRSPKPVRLGNSEAAEEPWRTWSHPFKVGGAQARDPLGKKGKTRARGQLADAIRTFALRSF